MQNAVPKEIRENIARAKGYLRRDELPRAMETMSLALRQSTGIQVLRPARFEMEIHFSEFLLELARHPGMQPLLDPENTGHPRAIPYQKNKEGLLATVLESLGKMLAEAAENRKKQNLASEEQRKIDLMETGVKRIQEGDLAKGRAFLKRAAAEFGFQPGVYYEVGKRLAATGQLVDAAEIFEKAIESAPKEPDAYAAAVDAYMQAMEYEKAEAVFLKILRQFGGHASTFGKMAQLYLAWHKRMKAEEFATRALHIDPQDANALEVMNKLDRRKS